MQSVLLITDNPAWVEQINQHLSHEPEVVFQTALHQEHAILQLKEYIYTGIILDLDSVPIDELGLFEYVSQQPSLASIPIIIYHSLELLDATLQTIDFPSLTVQFADTLSLVADQYTSSLEQTNTDNRTTKNKQNALVGKKILLVDDDVRNTFALTTFLKHKQMDVQVAHDGVEALAALEEHTDIDIVLMDIMMPEMDGYEAMQQIRKIDKFKKLPIIALTAKAMKDDKKKCIDAGASDYLTKPIDMDKLLSVMQVWLYQ